MSPPNIHRYLRHGTLPQLHLFEATARLGNFTRAAEELHMAQPTASVQIKKLSETIGVPLFEQVGKRVYLTDAGRRLLRQLPRSLPRLRHARGIASGHARAGIRSAAACGEHDGHVLRAASARRLRRASPRRRDLDAGPQPADADAAAREQRGRSLPVRGRAGDGRRRGAGAPAQSAGGPRPRRPSARPRDQHPVRTSRPGAFPPARGRIGHAAAHDAVVSTIAGSPRRSGWSSARTRPSRKRSSRAWA